MCDRHIKKDINEEIELAQNYLQFKLFFNIVFFHTIGFRTKTANPELPSSPFNLLQEIGARESIAIRSLL